MVRADLIKIDKNGSKHLHGMIPCDRCGGQGGSETWKFTGWTCYKCGGTGFVEASWIERTPEYEEVLAKRRAARRAKIEAEQAKINAEFELARKLEEERIAREKALLEAQKAISQYVGTVGEKYETDACFEHSAYFKARIGWKEDTMYVHTFKDVSGNVIVWKTSSGLGKLDLNYGEPVHIIGTVKEHSEYKDEKQTALIRCKITKIQ